MPAFVLGLVAGVLSVIPSSSLAEPDTVRPRHETQVRHVTLEGWDRRTRMAAWDRIHAVGGFYYDRGVLRRWTRQMDHEYDLDHFSTKPTLADDAAFYSSKRGFRTAAGSITNGSFVMESELQTTERLLGPLGISARFVQQEDLSAERAFLELGYHVDLGKGHRVGVRHSFASLKTDLDAELVYRFTRRQLEADLSVGRLDIVNNVVNEVLVPDPVHFDTLRVYRKAPYWFAGRVSVPIGPVRFEASGGITPESQADVRSQTVEQARFEFDNAFAYGGGLVEVEVLKNCLVVGAIASGSQSDAARRTPPEVLDRSDVASRQVQRRAGVFALARWQSLRAEAWWMHERASDRQDGSAFAGSTINKPYDIEERWDWARLRLDWTPGSRWGPTLGAEYAHGLRSYPVEGDLEEIQREVLRFFPYGPNRRLTVRAGFRFSRRAEVIFGVNRDLDNDTFYNDGGRPYDGAHVRIRVVQ